MQAANRLRIIGIDPGLRRTGWGVVDVNGNTMHYVASGVLKIGTDGQLPARLLELYHALTEIVQTQRPTEAAVECTFVNVNPDSTLKLGHARAIALLVPSLAGLSVAEYAPNAIKKSLSGFGHGDKSQIRGMVQRLLPGANPKTADESDALSIAMAHFFMRNAKY